MHANLQPFRVWDGQWGLLVMRIVSSLMGLLVIYAAYQVGQKIGSQHNILGLAAAGWIAFLPQFTFINALVHSDTVTNAIAAMVLWLAVLMQTSETNKKKYALGLGVLIGLGLLTKYTFAYMLAVGLLVVVMSNPREPRSWIKLALFILLPTMTLVGTYYLAFDEARAALINFGTRSTLKNLSWDYLSTVPEPLLLDLFYSRFGWANVAVPASWIRIAFGIWVSGTCLTILQAARLRKETTLRPSLTSIVVMGVTMLIAFVSVVYYNFSRYDPQGRFLFPALVAWSVFGLWGPSQMLTARGKTIAGAAVVGFMFVFNLLALFFCLVPAYY